MIPLMYAPMIVIINGVMIKRIVLSVSDGSILNGIVDHFHNDVENEQAQKNRANHFNW